MIGILIAVVMIAMFVFVLLRRMQTYDPRGGFLFLTATNTLVWSRHVPPGQMYVFSGMPELDVTPIRVKHQVTHDEMWSYLSEARWGLAALDPKAFVKIVGIT